MEKRVTVIVALPHRSGFAAGGLVEQGDVYAVPESYLPALVRDGLVEDPAAPAPAKRAAGKAG